MEVKRNFQEVIVDNLAFWAFVAVVIALLYGIWATIEILNHYIGTMPPYTPSGTVGR